MFHSNEKNMRRFKECKRHFTSVKGKVDVEGLRKAMTLSKRRVRELLRLV
jgi:hypothetical protein